MSRDGTDGPTAAATRLVLRLYVAGDGPNSTAARANLGRLLGGHAPGSYDIEIVDCLVEPLRAIEEGVFVTPTLLRVSPPPRRTIVGSLSAAANVKSALGLATDSGLPDDA
ncbi:MAG TPA: circadian clock KaiB family protein [Gemmatimonadaceae bacterium]